MPDIVSYHPRIFVINGPSSFILHGVCSDWMSDLDFLRAVAAAGNVTKVGQVVTLASDQMPEFISRELARRGISSVWAESIFEIPSNFIPVGWNYTL